MDRTLLKYWLGVALLGILPGCSLVVDTDECVTDADCDFGDDTRYRCVSNECVPITNATSQQALVPATVDDNLTLGGSTQWVIDGVVVVVPPATLTIEPEVTLELRNDAVIVVTKGASLKSPPALAPHVINENHGVCE